MAAGLLEKTLKAAVKDGQTVTPDGKPLAPGIDGMARRASDPIVDDRGSLFEIYNTGWGFHQAAVDHIYAVTLRPNVVKGWALHKHHEDRYFILSGEMQVILYDVRPGSSSYGRVVRVTLSDKRRELLSIPRMVWHADVNIGTSDALLLNMPTEPYNHADPDKYRLPIDTPLIPFEFGPNFRGY